MILIKVKDRNKEKPIKIPYGFMIDIIGKDEEEMIAFCRRNGFLICNGKELTTHDYPELFEKIGYFYGGSGNKFNLPNK